MPQEVPPRRSREEEKEWWGELLIEETVTVGDLIPDVGRDGSMGELEAEEPADRLLSLASCRRLSGKPSCSTPWRLRYGRDRHAPGPTREPGESGHRGGPAKAERSPAGQWIRQGGRQAGHRVRHQPRSQEETLRLSHTRSNRFQRRSAMADHTMTSQAGEKAEGGRSGGPGSVGRSRGPGVAAQPGHGRGATT